MKKAEIIAREQLHTVRQQIIGLLRDGPAGVRDISQALGLAEKEIYDHLAHIDRSLAAHGEKLLVSPYRCGGCGYLFEQRRKLTRPGRCPQCKLSHILPATYEIRGQGGTR